MLNCEKKLLLGNVEVPHPALDVLHVLNVYNGPLRGHLDAAMPTLVRRWNEGAKNKTSPADVGSIEERFRPPGYWS